MLINSNFKDYYDFLQGVYGIDKTIVYDRVCLTPSEKGWSKEGLYRPCFIKTGEIEESDENGILNYYFAVCGVMYCIYRFKNKFYYGNEVLKITPKEKRSEYSIRYDKKESASYNYSAFHLSKTDINDKENCPVILLKTSSIFYAHYYIPQYLDIKAKHKNIRLSDFGFAHCLSAEKAYLQISQFLTREKPIKDNRTDLQKITGKGFDKKYSFRKRKEE